MPPATTSGQAFNNLQSYTQGMKSPEQAATDANSQFGVNQAQQQVQGLRGAIQNTTNLLQQVAPSVMGRTANSLVTSAQADRQIQNEQTPLNTQLNTENQQYGNANQDYQNVLGEAQNQANSVLQGQQNQQSYLQGLYNDLSTKEQNAAQMAQQQRQFDATLAESRAARVAAGASPSFGSQGQNNSNPASYKGIAMGAPGSFQFSAGGKPITGYLWSQANGVDPMQTLAYMLQKGDTNAGNAITDIQRAGGITPQIMSKYSGFFGNSGGGGGAAKPAPVKNVKTANNAMRALNALSFGGMH